MAKTIKTDKVKKAPSLRIIKVTSYKDYPILVQHIIRGNVFQCIVFKDNQFYQAHEYAVKNKVLTTDEEIKFGSIMLDTAFQIVDALEANKETRKAELN